MKNTHILHIVCSKTNTNIGKIIRFLTEDDINHCSIYFDDEKILYSCRREYKYNLFSGKCGIETFDNMACGKQMYYEQIDIPISQEEYEYVINIISNSFDKKYDYIGLFAMKFHLNFRIKERFVCSTYVAYILTHLIDLNDNYENYTPISLRNELENNYIVKSFFYQN